MFQLDQQRCTFVHLNVRPEKHGDVPVIACDVNLKADVDSAMLDEFGKGLQAALFEKPKNGKQVPINGEGDVPSGPALRFAGIIKALKLEKEYAGYTVDLTWGDLAGSVQLKLADCKVTRFSVEPKEGGTCELQFQVQSRPDGPTIGQLAPLIQKEVTVSLVPPAAE